MKNKKHMILLLALLMTSASVFAQEAADAQDVVADTPIAPDAPPADTGNLPVVETDPNAYDVGNPRVADETLTTVLIDDFEVPQGWIPSIPLDFGISKILYREASPQEIATDVNNMVLGVKTVFFRRNYGWMSIDRPYPLSLKNIVRNFSIWISGRNRRHTFFIKIRDLENNRMRLSGGEMRFQGWKKISIPISSTVVQFNPNRNDYGIEFLGFHIAFDAEDISTIDPYYMYFDQLTASMNMASTQAPDDINDDW